MVQLWPRSGVS